MIFVGLFAEVDRHIVQEVLEQTSGNMMKSILTLREMNSEGSLSTKESLQNQLSDADEESCNGGMLNTPLLQSFSFVEGSNQMNHGNSIGMYSQISQSMY